MKKTTEDEIRIPTFVPETIYTYITALRAAVIEATNAAYIAERPILHDSGRNPPHYHQIVGETFHRFINTNGSPRAQLKLAEHSDPVVIHPLEDTSISKEGRELLVVAMLSLALTRASELLSAVTPSSKEKRKKVILAALKGEIEPVLTHLKRRKLIPEGGSVDIHNNPTIWKIQIAQYRIMKAHLANKDTSRLINGTLQYLNSFDQNDPAVKRAKSIIFATIAEIKGDLGSYEQALTYVDGLPEHDVLIQDINKKAKLTALNPKATGSLGQRIGFLFKN